MVVTLKQGTAYLHKRHITKSHVISSSTYISILHHHDLHPKLINLVNYINNLLAHGIRSSPCVMLITLHCRCLSTLVRKVTRCEDITNIYRHCITICTLKILTKKYFIIFVLYRYNKKNYRIDFIIWDNFLNYFFSAQCIREENMRKMPLDKNLLSLCVFRYLPIRKSFIQLKYYLILDQMHDQI